MPNATRKICTFPGCTYGEPDADENPTPYVTPPDLVRRDEVSLDMKEHVFMSHELPLRHVESQTNRTMAEATKIREEAAKIQAETACLLYTSPSPRD